MRSIWVFLLVALCAVPAWGKSKELARAIDLYESGQLSQARDQLQLLVDKRHFSESDRIQARLYLAATDLALQSPDSAREQLTILAKEHPKVRPDPAVFSPELVVLSEQIRSEVAQQRSGAGRSTRDQAAQAHAEQQKQTEAQARAEKQKQVEAQARADKQKQAEAQARAEKQKQAEAQARADKQKQAEAQARGNGKQNAVGEQQHASAANGPATQTAEHAAIGPAQADLNPRLQPVSPLAAQQEARVDAHPGRRRWGYVALGVAAGAAAVGALFTSGARSSAQEASTTTDPSKYKTAKSDAEGKASIASASFIAAGLAAAGGGVLIGTSF